MKEKRKVCRWLLFAAVGLVLSGCTTTKVVTVERVKTDTLVQTKHERDSVWLHDSIVQKQKGDTVTVERWHTRYVTRETHDTLYVSKTDSVPVSVPQVKTVEKKLTKVQKGLMTSVALSILALMVFVAFRLGRWWRF